MLANTAKRCQRFYACIFRSFPINDFGILCVRFVDSILLHWVCLNNLNSSHSSPDPIPWWKDKQARGTKPEHYSMYHKVTDLLSHKMEKTLNLLWTKVHGISTEISENGYKSKLRWIIWPDLICWNQYLYLQSPH